MQKFISKISAVSFKLLLGSAFYLSSLHAEEQIMTKDKDKKSDTKATISPALLIDQTNPALDRIAVLNILLADKTLDEKTKKAYVKELFGVLAGAGAANRTYGHLSEPITKVSMDTFPQSTGKAFVRPDLTGWWRKSTDQYFPTNDWLEQMAVYPKSIASNRAGMYTISYNEDGSLNYNTPLGFVKYEEDSFSGLIEQINDNGFTIGSLVNLNPHPFIKWQQQNVGNMVRHIVYQKMSYYVAQGSVLQGIYYKNDFPLMGLSQRDPDATFSISVLKDGTKKYRIATKKSIYLFYGNPSLNMEFDDEISRFRAFDEYNGLVNAASIPNNSKSAKKEKLLDQYANVVVVRGQGSLLTNGNYEFSYMCENLNKSPTSADPLILLNAQHVDNLVYNDLAKKENFDADSLFGKLQGYAGSAFYFQAPIPNASTSPIPTLPNGSNGILRSQASEVIATGLLDKGIKVASRVKLEDNIFNGGKGVYQIATTLAYAQNVLETARYSKKEIVDKLTPLYSALRNYFPILWQNLKMDKAWGAIVPEGDDKGALTYFNEHISLYSYLIYSLTLMSEFEKAYLPKDVKPFLNEFVKIEGYETFTNKDMGNILASDISQTSLYSFGPLYRNFDIYNAHSWLSGISGPFISGNSTTSQSEAVFGSLAVTAWLEHTQPDSVPAQFARTRWSLETQALNKFFHIGDASTSVYKDVSLSFAKKHPVISYVHDHALATQTSDGNTWDLIALSQLSPVGANLMDNFMNGDLNFAEKISQFILANWYRDKYVDPRQSLLIASVARRHPAVAQKIIFDLERRGRQSFDVSTNSFILYMITLYAANEKLFD